MLASNISLLEFIMLSPNLYLFRKKYESNQQKMYSVWKPQIYFLSAFYNQFISLYIMLTIGVIIHESPHLLGNIFERKLSPCNIKYD